jgi:hypothetical protein
MTGFSAIKLQELKDTPHGGVKKAANITIYLMIYLKIVLNISIGTAIK